ncbi:hypothetical protein RUM43_003883 [Polyplax serrata]
MMSAEDEEKINYLMPDIVLAVEALQLATADRIHQCLTECDIKASPSEIMMALEYGCRLGLMEERTRYRLNPELICRTNCFVDCCPEDMKQPRVMPPCCQPKEKPPKCPEECPQDDEPMPDSFKGFEGGF